MKKFLFVLAILALGLTACNKVELQETPEQTLAEAPVCYFNLPASFDGDAVTKGVTIAESTATTSFDEEDNIYVYIERASDYPAFGYDESTNELVPLTISNINGATCVLSGALKFYHTNPIEPYTPQENDIVHLLYNQNGNLHHPENPYFEYYRISGAKDGYKDPSGGGGGYPDNFIWGANHYDFAEAVMKVTAVSGDEDSGYSLTLGKVDNPTNPWVSFKNLQSMFRQRLSFTDADGIPVTPAPAITRFRIRSSNRSVVERYYPLKSNNSPFYHYHQGLKIDDPVISGDGDIYFPLLFNDVNKNDALIFMAYDDEENVYTVTKNAPANGFANGKYYYGEATLAWLGNMKPTVDGTTATPDQNIYTITDNPVNLTISGYSEGYRFKLSHGGTVTLNNATAELHSGPFIQLVASSAELQLVLTGTNSLESEGYNCIESDGTSTLKLSCTGASATLTVTVNGDRYCGLEGANYTISDDSSDPTANRYDIATERDVTTQLAAPGFTVTRSARTDNADGTCTWTYTVAPDPAATPLTLKAIEAGSVTVIKNGAPGLTADITYRVNGGTEQTVSFGTAISLNADDEISFYSTNARLSKNAGSGLTYISTTNPCYVYGNVMSLIDDSGNGFANDKIIGADYALACLFYNASNLRNHPSRPLLLPATTLSKHCYEGMFSLCTNLTTAPSLPAETLAEGCYAAMFLQCSSLNAAPDLKAPTLVKDCYNKMFEGCTNLASVKCLATSGFDASNCLYTWLKNVAATGTFTKASGVTAWPTGESGIPAGWTVQ